METFLRNESSEPGQTDVYQDLSSHLYRVLDVVGVSEEVREGYREAAAVQEIVHTAVDKVTEDASWYIFGSQYEGTTTFGLQSDTDMLFCDERLQVVENIDDAPVDGLALLMLSDDTKPGYVKLQSVVNRTKQTFFEREVTNYEDTDQQRRILVKHIHSGLPTERHGPADTLPAGEGRGEVDIVNAYRCRAIPSFADEWLHRPRPYQWPSRVQLQRMCKHGCFFVGVSHPKSENKDIEFRMSYSLQERDLMSSLNITQHKCYVLLKIIKKDILQPRVGKSLSSYHCKTCIFHLAERRGVEEWTPNKLLFCLLECLRLLLDWVRQENCPNYFIKDENMFDKLKKCKLKRLARVLQELLSNGVQFLYEIKCDDLGMLLRLSKSDRRLEEKKLEVEQKHRHSRNIDMTTVLLSARGKFYRLIDNSSTRLERVFRANHIVQYLENTTIITENKSKDVRMALDRLLPYVRFLIVQMKCSNTLDQISWITYNEVIQSIAREVKICNHCNLISSRLIVASLYLQCDKLDSCQEILLDCDTSLKPYVTSMCACHHDYPEIINNRLAEKIVAENLSFEEFRRECTADCMIFLPSEANLVPAALRYEMYRSVYTPPGSRDNREYFWFDWIVVDSKVYLYFLQCALYTKTNDQAYKQDALHNFILLITTDPNLGHRETALNLLGWIYMQENRFQDAFVCFCRSLAIRPLHNAAKWHMAILLHSLITPQTINKRECSSSCDDDTELPVYKRRKRK